MKWFDRLKQRLRPSRPTQADRLKDAEERARRIAELKQRYPNSYGAQLMRTIGNGFDDVVTAEEAVEQDRRWVEMQRPEQETRQRTTTPQRKAS